MPIIGNPWVQEAGAMGQGLGQTLGNAMINMPHQRAMLAMQAAAQRQSQQQAMLRYALEQQQMQQQAMLGQSEHVMRQAELAKQLQALEHANAMAEQRLELAKQGKWTITKMPDGSAVLLNSLTGEHKRPDLSGGGQANGLGSMPQTQNQTYEAFKNLGTLAGNQRAAGMDNPSNSAYGEFNTTTNLLHGLGQRLQALQQGGAQMPQLGAGATNMPAGLTPQASPNASSNRFRWTPQGLVPQ